MFTFVVSCLKKMYPFWNSLESIFYYLLGLLLKEKEEEEVQTKYSPEQIWALFLHELDELFNIKGIHLDYALSTACSNVFCKTGVYVLEDKDFIAFSYYDTIFDKVQKRYIELLENYFNVANYDFSTAVNRAKEHVKEELHITNLDFDNLKEEYGFNERQVIDAV